MRRLIQHFYKPGDLPGCFAVSNASRKGVQAARTTSLHSVPTIACFLFAKPGGRRDFFAFTSRHKKTHRLRLFMGPCRFTELRSTTRPSRTQDAVARIRR